MIQVVENIQSSIRSVFENLKKIEKLRKRGRLRIDDLVVVANVLRRCEEVLDQFWSDVLPEILEDSSRSLEFEIKLVRKVCKLFVLYYKVCKLFGIRLDKDLRHNYARLWKCVKDPEGEFPEAVDICIANVLYNDDYDPSEHGW